MTDTQRTPAGFKATQELLRLTHGIARSMTLSKRNFDPTTSEFIGPAFGTALALLRDKPQWRCGMNEITAILVADTAAAIDPKRALQILGTITEPKPQ